MSASASVVRAKKIIKVPRRVSKDEVMAITKEEFESRCKERCGDEITKVGNGVKSSQGVLEDIPQSGKNDQMAQEPMESKVEKGDGDEKGVILELSGGRTLDVKEIKKNEMKEGEKSEIKEKETDGVEKESEGGKSEMFRSSEGGGVEESEIFGQLKRYQP